MILCTRNRLTPWKRQNQFTRLLSSSCGTLRFWLGNPGRRDAFQCPLKLDLCLINPKLPSGLYEPLGSSKPAQRASSTVPKTRIPAGQVSSSLPADGASYEAEEVMTK